MQSQLEALVEAFKSAQSRLDELIKDLTDEQWVGTVDPTRWSAAQCVEHLNLTSAAFIPVLQEALEKSRARDGKPPDRYRLDFAGWIVSRASGPARGFGKIRTSAPFVPRGGLTREQVIREFMRLQNEQIKCVQEADGMPLGKVKIASPFNAKLHYNVYSALSILPRHQHRHLQQAERAVAAARHG